MREKNIAHWYLLPIGFVLLAMLLASATAACVPQTTSIPAAISPASLVNTQQPDPVTPTSSATESPTSTPTPSPSITSMPSNTPTATITHIPPALAQFNSPILRSWVTPVSYLTDMCEYLRLRWGVGKAEPGTVVVPVMFHGVVEAPTKISDPKDISVEEFQAFIHYATWLGYETITSQELLDFLLYNEYIPPRSMILIVDDRRPGSIEEHFLPVLEENDWTVTSAYIANPNSLEWAWEWMSRLYETGRVDIQSHGYSGQLYFLPETPLEQVQREIWYSTEVLEERFGERPIAFIWPGGNFSAASVQVAREGGYQLGFSAYTRGPLLFNWIPLGEQERLVNDPLMVLPRAWSNSVNYNLDEAVRISEQAVSFAEEYGNAESIWLDTYCGGE